MFQWSYFVTSNLTFFHFILFILLWKPYSLSRLQLSPSEYSPKPISHLSFELQSQLSKCQLDICAWIFCCHFKPNMLKTNLSSYLLPHQFADFHVSVPYTLSLGQSLMLIFTSFFPSRGYIFFSYTQCSHSQNSFVYPCFVWGVAYIIFCLFLILQDTDTWWIFSFVYKTLYRYLHLFLIYRSVLTPTYFFLLLSLHFFPCNSFPVLLRLLSDDYNNIYIINTHQFY